MAITLSRRRAACFNLYLSGLTLHPQPWPSPISPLQEATDQAWTEKGCSPPRYSPTSVYPQHSRNISSPGIAGIPPVFGLKAPRPRSSKWKLEPAVPSPHRLDLTKPQTSYLVTLSWINKISWAFLISHGKADFMDRPQIVPVILSRSISIALKSFLKCAYQNWMWYYSNDLTCAVNF